MVKEKTYITGNQEWSWLKEEVMQSNDSPSTVREPLLFLFAESVKVSVASSGENGVAMEHDTKDPYVDCSDTV